MENAAKRYAALAESSRRRESNSRESRAKCRNDYRRRMRDAGGMDHAAIRQAALITLRRTICRRSRPGRERHAWLAWVQTLSAPSTPLHYGEAIQREGFTMQAAVGYLRVSTREQGRRGFSLETQRRDIESFGTREGFTVKSCYRDVQTIAPFCPWRDR